MKTTRRRVIVGVDGGDGSLRAVRFAALAADAAGDELEVVHVMPTILPVGPVRPVEPPNLDDVGTSIAEDAAMIARVTVPGLTVHVRVVHGSAVRRLAQASADADLVVLGARHDRALNHIWTGRLAAGLGARASCPMVVVPPEWEPSELRGRVVVGFKESVDCLDLLADAFADASRRGADLIILHAWKLPSAYDDIIGARVAEETYREHARHLIEPLITDLRVAYPGVHVSIRVQHAQAARALVDASHDADAIVLTRPTAHQGVPHLGSTARAVLHWATCPVIVYPARAGAAPSKTSMSLERDGALQR